MIVSPIPENEAERIAALQQFQILDTAPEQDFDLEKNVNCIAV